MNEPSLTARIKDLLSDMEGFIEAQKEAEIAAFDNDDKVTYSFTRGVRTGFELVKKSLEEIL